MFFVLLTTSDPCLFINLFTLYRDQIMVSAISRRLDDNAGELLRQLLKQMYLRTEPWAATSNPVPFTELRETVRKQNSHPLLGQYVDQYLKIMGNY